MSNNNGQKMAGKVAVVTGGSRGIVAAIAKRLAADGASVAIMYANDASAASAVVKAVQLDGGKAIAIRADAADVEAVRGAVDETRRKAAVEFVLKGLESGALKPVIDRVFKFDDMVGVHRYLENNGQFGKIVVNV